MRERPIIMGSESIKGILEGRKTHTRRVIVPQPDASVVGLVPRVSYAGNVLWGNLLGTGKYVELNDRRCPYGQAGDRLWVKEVWALDVPGCPNGLSYNADHIDPRGDGPANPMKWRFPLFMPRWASRITLKITSVEAERLQDIAEEDAIAEGLYPWTSNEGKVHYGINRADVWELDPRLTYKRLWNSLNAKRGYPWASNPWVWDIGFERVEP